MQSQDIRRKFLKFFKEKGHTIVPSSPVVPHDDPTLLFTNAGMNQFKDVFLGQAERDYTRASTSQKCIRVGGKHNDLDNVGHTSRHLTFFEMLGNFSFGDYFKQEAIAFAWEISTEVFGFDPDKIWPTVFETDEEAFAYWKCIVPEHRIIRMGEKDNFWAMGDTGPCGPCSELLYDRGEAFGSAHTPKEDPSGERFLEFWNLVFMQFNRDAAGTMCPLPKQSIDTGAGLERIVGLKMGVDTVFATDIFMNLIAQIEHVSGKKYHAHDLKLAPAYHVIADHLRSLSFAISDGAQPSNVERGYILRKLLRRAVRYGRMLDMHEPFLAKILPRLVDVMGPDYRELVANQARIAEILTLEEEAFIRTLKRGGNILSSVIEKAKEHPHKQITGEEAFKLKDTYGFPLEEILLIAKDTGLQVNLDAYELLEEQAREKSKSAHHVHAQVAEESLFKDYLAKYGPCEFVGFDDTFAQASVLALVKDGAFVESLNQGDEGMILLDKTPFYAEKGGQIGDLGTLTHHRAHVEITDCHSPYPGVIVHFGRVEQGSLILGEPINAQVNSPRRQRIANNHTATHLLHWGLQQILGEHIRQAGSLVEPERLRFDFNHHKPLTRDELRQLELLVNEKIREGKPVSTYELSYEEAQRHPDIKQFFGEKYGTKVRVVDIGYSKELCGGTHTAHVGTIGYFRITKEGSIAAGVRRIEAMTGIDAEKWIYAQEEMVEQIAGSLKVTVAKLPEKVAALVEENKGLSQELKHYRAGALKQMAAELKGKALQAGSVSCIAEIVEVDADLLVPLAEELMLLFKSGVLVLGIKGTERCQLLVKVSPDLIQKGIQAVQLIKEIAPLIGGSGGGKADAAQAGGKHPDGLPQALQRAHSWLAQH